MRAITVEEICKRLKPVLGKKVDQIYLKYSLSESREDKEQIQRMLNVLYEKHLNTNLLSEKILLAPPEQGAVSGEYELGEVTYSEKESGIFGLRENDWPRHLCVTGMSGSGKTTFAFKIIDNFIKNEKPFLIFDWKKSFRPLMQIDEEIMCFTVGNEAVSNLFKVNITEPPKGVNPKVWVSILCDLIVESFSASFGVHKLLREVLDKAFKDFGVYKGSNNYPTWKQIKIVLEEKAADPKNKKGRESEWLESSLRIVDSLTFGSFGDAINCKEKYGYKVEELLDKKILFELHALGTAEKKFFCEYILNYIYLMKKFNQEGYSSEFKNAIIVDEAHHIFLKDKPNFVKESITEMIYRELREYGIALVCLDQHISKLSEVVSGNSATNIAFQQLLPQDVENIAGLMQMRDNKKFFSMLPVGEAIVKLAERHHEPFQIKVPFMDIKSNFVLDEDIKEKMKEIVRSHKQKMVAADMCTEKNMKKLMKKIDQIFKNSGVRTKGDYTDLGLTKEEILDMIVKHEDPESCLQQLTNIQTEHKDFLHAIGIKPLTTTQVYKKLRLSSRKCDSLRKDLIDQGLIEVEEIRNQRGRAKLLKLSEKGTKLLSITGKSG